METALKEFWSFAKDFRSIQANIAKAAICAPLVDIVLKIGSPWPSVMTASMLASLIQVVIIMLAYEFWKQGRPRKVDVRKWLLVSSVCFFCVLIVYIWAFSQYIVVQDIGGSHAESKSKVVDQPWWFSIGSPRVVTGYEVKPEVQKWIDYQKIKLTRPELIFEWGSPDNVWTEYSLNTMRFIFLVLWLSLWGSLSATISGFLALQWVRKPYARASGS